MELNAQQYTASGISAANRRRLEQLHRGSKGPVTVREAAHILGIDATTTARLLAHWCSHGWIQRVRRGLYVLVPLGAAGRVGVVADPWIFIARAFAPCYIGGWSACEHLGPDRANLPRGCGHHLEAGAPTPRGDRRGPLPRSRRGAKATLRDPPCLAGADSGRCLGSLSYGH